MNTDILHILEATTGGTKRFLLDTLCHASRLGYSQSVIYSSKRSTDDLINEQYCDQLPHIQFYQVSMERKINIFADFKATLQILQIIKSINPRIVHLHSSKAGGLGRLTQIFSRKKFILLYSPHGISSHISFHYGLIERWLKKHVNYFVAVSKGEISDLEKFLNIQEKDIKLVSPGLNLDEFRIKSMSPHQLVVGSCGLISKQKDPFKFQEVVSRLNKEFGDQVAFKWIGDGRLRHKLSDLITVTGWLNEREALLNELQTLDILILTSRYESFGYVVAEASAFQIPAVITPVAGISELVVHNQTGFISDGTVEDIFQKVKGLIIDSDLRKNFGLAARKHIQENFTSQKMADSLKALYDEMIKLS